MSSSKNANKKQRCLEGYNFSTARDKDIIDNPLSSNMGVSFYHLVTICEDDILSFFCYHQYLHFGFYLLGPNSILTLKLIHRTGLHYENRIEHRRFFRRSCMNCTYKIQTCQQPALKLGNFLSKTER
jgi:hypothetical protein